MIKDIKDLRAVFKLCRAQGVTEIKLNGVEIKFGEMPAGPLALSTLDQDIDASTPWADFPDRVLTPEELTYYSAGGKPPLAEDTKDSN